MRFLTFIFSVVVFIVSVILLCKVTTPVGAILLASMLTSYVPITIHNINKRKISDKQKILDKQFADWQRNKNIRKIKPRSKKERRQDYKKIA